MGGGWLRPTGRNNLIRDLAPETRHGPSHRGENTNQATATCTAVVRAHASAHSRTPRTTIRPRAARGMPREVCTREQKAIDGHEEHQWRACGAVVRAPWSHSSRSAALVLANSRAARARLHRLRRGASRGSFRVVQRSSRSARRRAGEPPVGPHRGEVCRRHQATWSRCAESRSKSLPRRCCLRAPAVGRLTLISPARVGCSARARVRPDEAVRGTYRESSSISLRQWAATLSAVEGGDWFAPATSISSFCKSASMS